MGEGVITSSHSGETGVVVLSGEHDAASIVNFNRTLAELDGRPILIDLGATTLLDSRILGALLGWSAEAARASRPFAIVLPRAPSARRLVEIVGGGRLRAFDSAGDALAALTGQPRPLR